MFHSDTHSEQARELGCSVEKDIWRRMRAEADLCCSELLLKETLARWERCGEV